MHLRALAIDALGLVAPRSVAIQDWRLLILLQALRGLVAFYVLYSLINGKTYLQQEVPHGTISNIGTSTEYFDGLVDKHAFHAPSDGATTTVTASNGVSRTFDLMPCSDATAIDAAYKFNRSFGFEFDHLMCAFLDSDELVREFPSGGIFVTTHVYYKLVYRTRPLRRFGRDVRGGYLGSHASGVTRSSRTKAHLTRSLCGKSSATSVTTPRSFRTYRSRPRPSKSGLITRTTPLRA